jgi:hypothetical protein
VVVSLGVALLSTLVLAAPTRAGFSITYPKGPDPAVREWPQWPYPVSCGGLPFDPVAAFGGPTDAQKGSGGPELALVKYLDAVAAQTTLSKHYWRLVAATETRAEFAEGRLDQGPAWLAFQLSGGEWKPAGTLGYCVPRTVKEGSEGASWRIDGSQRLGPSTRRVKVNLSAGSGGCDGGRSLNDDARTPEFRQYGKKLVMTIWLEPLTPGIHTCKKRIEPPLVVRLPGRLGDRRLFDGRTYPPRLRQ